MKLKQQRQQHGIAIVKRCRGRRPRDVAIKYTSILTQWHPFQHIERDAFDNCQNVLRCLHVLYIHETIVYTFTVDPTKYEAV